MPPLYFAPNDRVEWIQMCLEEHTFKSRCVGGRLAHAKITTNCGIVLDECGNLQEYPVRNGDTLTVFLVPVLRITFGLMPNRIFAGDFWQLPALPAYSTLLASLNESDEVSTASILAGLREKIQLSAEEMEVVD